MANLLYTIPFYAAKILYYVTTILLVIVPFIFYTFIIDMERKSFTVPEFLSLS